MAEGHTRHGMCVCVAAVYMSMRVWYVYIRGLAKTGNQGGFTLFFETSPSPLLFSSPPPCFCFTEA